MDYFNSYRIIKSRFARQNGPGCAVEGRKPMGRDPVQKQHAFTLVELLVVVAIVSILAAMLLPALSTALDSARTVQCTTNVKRFALSLALYMNDTRDYVPDHAGDDHVTQGRMTPAFPHMRAGGYVEDLRILLCPTAPSTYAWAAYDADPHDRDALPFKWFWYQEHPKLQYDAGQDRWYWVSLYDAPMGTYYYWGGAPNNSNTNRRWCPGSGYRMRESHVRNASAYAVLWDQDPYRRGVDGDTTRMAMSSHRYRPGKSYGFLDGHVAFVPDSRYASCTALVTADSWNHMSYVTEHVTPVVSSTCVLYYQEGKPHGKLYYGDDGRKAAAAVLNLP